jgi:hypothetical protein
MLGWYYFTKIMSRSTSGLTDDRCLESIREIEGVVKKHIEGIDG